MFAEGVEVENMWQGLDIAAAVAVGDSEVACKHHSMLAELPEQNLREHPFAAIAVDRISPRYSERSAACRFGSFGSLVH